MATAFPIPVEGIGVPFTVKTPDPLPPEALSDCSYRVLISAYPVLPAGSERDAVPVMKFTDTCASFMLAS